jgi:hypothetical protein
VGVGEVARQHPVLLDALARERVELRARLLELGAQPLPLVRPGAGIRAGQLLQARASLLQRGA